MNVYRFFLHGLVVALLGFTLCVTPGTNTQAQPSGARNDDFIYQVVQNDTLIALAQRFTDRSENWQTLQQLNNVKDPFQLGIGQRLRIPFALIPELPSKALVTHLTGLATANGRTLAMGDELVEGDTLVASAGGYVTLTLEDNSVSSVTASSSLRIQRLRTFQGTGLIDAIFTMEQGSVESTVAPQNTGVGRFEIRTPVSITGVRGTRLRVHATQQGIQAEVLEGYAQQGSGAQGDPTIKQGQGAATTPDGQFLGVRNLLPAPVLQPLATAHSRIIQFAPVVGAQSYAGLVARDAAGTQLVYDQTIMQSPFTVRTPGPGNYYVFLRAVDADGVMGHDAVQSVVGQAVLSSSDGLPVLSGQGVFISLNEY